MRVCFISFEYPPHILGGAGTYAESIVNGLRDIGIDVVVITRGDTSSFDGKVFRIQTSDAAYWRRLLFIRPAMEVFRNLDRSERFDLVHFNEPHVLIRKPPLPTMCTLHSSQVNEMRMKFADLSTLRTVIDVRDLVFKGIAGSFFDVLTSHATDKIISPSVHLANLIRSYCIVDESKLAVIPNGLDLAQFDRKKTSENEILEKYGLEKDGYLLFMGRLSALKGIQYLIEAFRFLNKSYSKLKLAIAGSGDFEKYLRHTAKDMNNVVFTGYIDSLSVKKTFLRNSLFVVVPSLYEALPMVVLEAMACEKALIATKVGDIPLLVRDGKNGFLVNPGDVASLVSSMRVLCDDSNLRATMGLFGRRLIETEFNSNEMACQTLKVYNSLLEFS